MFEYRSTKGNKEYAKEDLRNMIGENIEWSQEIQFTWT
jgi:hypothetical protein